MIHSQCRELPDNGLMVSVRREEDHPEESTGMLIVLRHCRHQLIQSPTIWSSSESVIEPPGM